MFEEIIAFVMKATAINIFTEYRKKENHVFYMKKAENMLCKQILLAMQDGVFFGRCSPGQTHSFPALAGSVLYPIEPEYAQNF